MHSNPMHPTHTGAAAAAADRPHMDPFVGISKWVLAGQAREFCCSRAGSGVGVSVA